MKSDFKGIVEHVYARTLRLANEGQCNVKRAGKENESNIRIWATLRWKGWLYSKSISLGKLKNT